MFHKVSACALHSPAGFWSLILAMRRFHWFAYSNVPRREEAPKLHQTRDGAAAMELGAALTEKGWTLGSIIYNYPHHKLGHQECNRYLQPGDLLLCVHRLPMDDCEQRDRRVIVRSENHLEKALFEQLREHHITKLSRQQVILNPRWASLLPTERADFACMEFSVQHEARLTQCMALKEGASWHPPITTGVRAKSYVTVGFFIYLRSIPRYLCSAIVCWSQGGPENHLFAHIVRTRFIEWLERPCAALVKLTFPQRLPGERYERHLTMEFADACDVYQTEVISHYLL